jgi:acid phosphatase
MRRLIPAILVLAAALDGQPKTYENLNALLWMRHSAEYKAIAWQTFQNARLRLLEARADRNWTAAPEQEAPFGDLPPAIILDLDETVLDNSSYRVKLNDEGAGFTEEGWVKWVEQEQAGAVPGAVEFLQFAHAEGVAAFYITNRVCDSANSKDHTVVQLRALHFPFQSGRLLCRGAKDSSEKSIRRAKVAATHRILLEIGDDLNDFVAIPNVQGDAKARLAARERVIQAYRSYWGVRWLVLPNPMYGSWERAIGESLPAKLNALGY